MTDHNAIESPPSRSGRRSFPTVDELHEHDVTSKVAATHRFPRIESAETNRVSFVSESGARVSIFTNPTGGLMAHTDGGLFEVSVDSLRRAIEDRPREEGSPLINGSHTERITERIDSMIAAQPAQRTYDDPSAGRSIQI